MFRPIRLVVVVALVVATNSFSMGQDALKRQQPAPTPDDKWSTTKPDSANASFMMPGTPEASERKMNPVEGHITTVYLQVLNTTPTTSYVFTYNELPRTPDSVLALNETLDGGVKGAVARSQGLVRNVDKITVGNFQGRDFTFFCTQGKGNDEITFRVTTRLILVKSRLYQLTYVTKNREHSDIDAKKFIESFTYIPPPPEAEKKTEEKKADEKKDEKKADEKKTDEPAVKKE